MTKAEVIAEAYARGADKQEIEHLEAAEESEFVTPEPVGEGKELDNVEKSADALSEESALNTELNLEDTSSDLSVEEIEVDPVKEFLIKPSFFGKVGKDGGIIDSPDEDWAAEELNKKLGGLGIKVDKDTDGYNIIKIITPATSKLEKKYQESITLGSFDYYFTSNQQTPQEKADKLNGLIMDVIELKKAQNEFFDLETYIDTYDKAVNDTPEFYALSEDGGRFLELDELNYDQLQSHTQKVNLNLMNDYFQSTEGKENAIAISTKKRAVEATLTKEAFGLMIGKTYEKQLAIATEYTKKISDAHTSIFNNNASFQNMLSNASSVTKSLFDDKLIDLHAQEQREDKFGGFIASSDILTAFAKGATVVFPKEIQEFSAIQRNSKIEKLKKQLAKLNGVDGNEQVNGLGYFETNAPEKSFKGGKYKASELKFKLLNAIAHNEMQMMGNLLKAKEYEGVLALLSKPNEEMFKDGKLNITADNWQMALGDQGFRMLSSMFSGGMTTVVSEAGGAYSQILEGLGKKEYGDEWAGMTAKKKAEAFMRYVDSDEVDWEKAMAVGGVNMVLENLSNVFFVSKVAKPITSNLIGYFKLFMKGKIKQGLVQIGRGTGVKELMPILSTTLVETITEGLQEEVTQYGVGTALNDYSRSWNSTLNSMITAAVTTPFIGGGAKTTNMVYSEISAKLVAMRSKDDMVKYAQKQKELWVEQVSDGTMTQEEYDKNMLYIDAIPNMFTEADREVTDSEAMVMIFEAQLKIEEQKKKYNELEKKKEASKDLFPLKKEEINEAENEAELESIIEELEKAELQKRKGKRLDAYRAGNYESVSEINTDAVYSKDFEGKLFNTNEEALKYLEENYGIKSDNPAIAKFVEGKANGITLTPEDMKKILGTPYSGKGVFFISDKAVVDGIMDGDKYSSNAVKHEIDHVRMYYQTTEVLQTAKENIIDKLKKSKSPQMQEVSRLLADRIRDYEKAFGKDYLETRDGIEEFFTSVGDVVSVLSSNVSTLEDRKTILNIGKEFASLLNLEEAKNTWDVEKTLEFLQTFPNTKKLKPQVFVDENGVIVTSVDEDANSKFSLKDGRQSDLILIEDSNPYGKTKRDNVEIYEENKRLNKLIEKNETFVHPDGDMEMQERIRKEGGKKYRDQLLFNNYAQFKDLLKAYKDDHALHTDERKEFFVGQAMEQFVKALGTYNRDKQGNYQMKNDSFSAYYFGDPKTDVAGKTKDGRSIAKLRLVQIWEDMKAEFTIQIEDMTGEESMSDYDQDYIIDIQDKLNDYNERSALREGLARVMEFEVDGPMYNTFVNEVSQSLVGFDFETIFDPNAPQVMRNKGMNLWKGFKKFMELDLSKNPNVKDSKIYKNGQPTEFYKELITDNVETYYNQLDQKTFNDIFIDHTEVVIDEDTNPETGRLTVTGGKKAKGIKDKNAGNVKRKKKKFTPEIEAAILEQLLKTDQIAQLTAEGKTNAEIHKVIRMDMVQQSTLKNFTDILFKDAAMQVVTSEAFKSENGIGASETSQMALLMDKGIDAKFQLVDGTKGVIDASIGSAYFVQQVNRITRSVDGYTDSSNYEDVIEYILADKIAPKEIKDWVASMYNKGAVEAAGERKFKGYTVKNENIPAEIRKAFNDGGNIKFNTNARSEMVKNAAVMTSVFGKEFMDAVGFSFLGFQGGSRYLDIAGRKVVDGWSKLSKEEQAKRISKNPNAKYQKGVTGTEFESYNSIVDGLKSIPEENLPAGITYEDLANVRIMNIGAGGKGGIFARHKATEKQVADGKLTRKEADAFYESSGFNAEVDAANVANEKVMKGIIQTLSEKINDGSLDEVGMLEMFKMQSNLVFGLRGLSRVDGFLKINGPMSADKWKAIKWKGEHAKSMSQVSADIVDLIYRKKSNPKGVNLDAEIDLILAEYTQILGDGAVFDVLDEAGKTNVLGINRLGYLSDNAMKGITNGLGENARDIQARLLIKRQIKENVIKSQKKAEAVENINLKNTSTGVVQGASVFDFDGTLEEGGRNIIVATNSKTGEVVKVSSHDFHNRVEELIAGGFEFNFDDFVNVKESKKGPMFQKLLNQVKKYGVENIHILTARQPGAALAIQMWLEQNGVSLLPENITGLGVLGPDGKPITVTGKDKADWIESNLILNGFNDIYFVDDGKKIVDAVDEMFATYPEGLLVDGGKSVLVEGSKASTKRKVIFMTGGPGSSKSTVINKLKLDNYTILNPDAIMEPLLKAAGLPLNQSLLETKEQRSAWAVIQQRAIKEFKNQIIEARNAGKGVVIDGTGASAKVMQAYYDLFKIAGYNMGAINVQTSLETALERNAGRDRVLRDEIVIDTWNKVQANISLYKTIFGDNYFEIETDGMLMDDVLPPDFVRDIDSFTLVNPIEISPDGGKYSLNDTFNEILETSTKIGKEKVYSEAIGKIEGDKHSSAADMIYPPSAYDFEMFTYRYITGGEIGDNQKLFFKEYLQDPYERATREINKEKQAVRNGYKDILKELPNIKKNLKEEVEGTKFNLDQAVRVYLWNKNGIEIPGISKRDEKALVAAVVNSEELTLFADKLSALSRQKEGYIAPSEFWTVEGIAHDLGEITGRAGRAKHLIQWKENMELIFSKENKAKLRVAYGNDHVEALENMLYRMEYGVNPGKTGRIEQNWNNWVNNSVGAIMFFNMRSAALQTISAVNYIDWENNNVARAGLAFANQPQYWKDFTMIYNSDFLKERREGNQRTVNEAELTNAIKGSKNKAKAALAYLLEKGFTPTQIADSFAISSGGAAFYRNTVKAYEKSGMTTEEAESQAFIDFQAKTELGQQSSRPDLISQQQAGGLGRLILAFKNTPMQYNRLMIKAGLDIKNGRGDLKSNLSKIAYYGTVQNIIFNSLQTALWSALGDEDEWDEKTDRVAQGMIDSILGGLGLTGSIAITMKNGFMEYRKQKAKGFTADHTRTILQFANLSPTIGSKLRKLYGGIMTEEFNEEAIKEMGFTIENPAFSALAHVISGITNIPVDRAVKKIHNIILASSSETEAMDRIALVMGYSAWDLGLTTNAQRINTEIKARNKEEKKVAKKALDFKKANDYSKKKEAEYIKDQEKQKEEGRKVTCSYTTQAGNRCKTPIVEGKTRCTIHEEVKMKEGGVKSQCTYIKKNKKRCGVQTASKSGLCYYHD
jgi:predicted kinase